MPFGVRSEVGTLRKVIVHRPGLEHSRLTPANAEELLFDDVLWVEPRQGRARHVRARRCASGASRCSSPSNCSPRHSTSPKRRSGSASTSSTSVRSASLPRGARKSGSMSRTARWSPTSSSAASPRQTSSGRRSGLGVRRPDEHAAAAAAELPLPARPVVLDLRRRHAQPDDEAGSQARDDDHGGDLPLPPDVRRRRSSRSGSAAPTRTGGACTSRAVTCSRSATARS